METVDKNLVAPCGMICWTCLAYLREKNRCNGCASRDVYKWKSAANCTIRNCSLRATTESKFCYDCERFPCRRLKNLDKRYRTRYNTSFIENLVNIKNNGLEVFVQQEYAKRRCPVCGGTVCIHRGFCLDYKKSKIQ
mgnify:CR=1 FL=1